MGAQYRCPPSYYKILTYGSAGTEALLDGPVLVSEKVDGSQFRFGICNGEFYMASHHKQIHEGQDYGMFREGVEHVLSIRGALEAFAEHIGTENLWIFAEYLQKPKQNVLAYDRVPRNHLAVWAVMIDAVWVNPSMQLVEDLGLEAVPYTMWPMLYTHALLEKRLEDESFLGGQRVEGLVISNGAQTIAIGPRVQPLICKLVRPEFKEQHKVADVSGKSKIEQHMESYRAEARWLKAVQRAGEAGELQGAPQDIGPLLKSINDDILAEEEENIKSFLWQHYRKDYLRAATRGFPEWYKDRLRGEEAK